jgi:hypothetical protein
MRYEASTSRHARGLAALSALAALALVPATAGAETRVFAFTGAEQVFPVPAGVTSIDVTATGSAGHTKSPTVTGGRAAVVRALLPVTPGQVLYVEVGGRTGDGPGFNGGALNGGGGATDVRTVPRASAGTLASRLIVAAGGGGAGDFSGKDADVPSPAAPCVPGTATQSAGGEGRGDGASGTLGSGGAGWGGGGGGLYGGGGSGYTGCSLAWGGGGGSSLVPAGGANVLAERTTAASVRMTFTRPAVTLPPPPVVLVPRDLRRPVITRLAISPAAFSAANSGPALTAAVGGRVFYRLSEAASVRFTVERARKGRRKGRRCTARGKGRRCTRYVKLRGGFSHAGTTGLNEFRFMGRLRGRALRPGRYRLVAVGTDAARNRSGAVRRKFFIK